MEDSFIKIRGARVHNLKNINVDIPRNKLVVITGVSGSGKSSLALDTLYAEGQRRYVESLSPYARQFLGIMEKPDADKIEGISPAIAIDQKNISRNPRSTVGTITEIYDYLRLLYSRIGIPYCPKCGRKIQKQTIDQIVDRVLKVEGDIVILGPVISQKKGEHKGVIEEIDRLGFLNLRINGRYHPIEEAKGMELDKNKKHSIEVVVDRLKILNLSSGRYQKNQKEQRARLNDSIETALKIGKGLVIVSHNGRQKKSSDILFSEKFSCPICGVSLPEIEPRFFSFNSPFGACFLCSGLGEKLEVDPELVVPNKNLSLAEGAILPWAKASHKVGRQSWFWWKLQNFASEYNFSLNTPFKKLPPKAQKVVLYGNGNEGWKSEGVITNIERRWKETESDATREEIEQYMMVKICPDCKGKRLRGEALSVKISDKSIDDVVRMNISQAKEFFETLKSFKLSKNQKEIGLPIIKEIINRLQFLIDVGLDYLSLDRKGGTLAGGEAQRIRLATQIGSRLVGVTYILDEPSIGLHPRDQSRLISSLKKLKDLGNTVIVVEHDAQTILSADWVIDVGPGAGREGGKVTFEGTPRELLRSDSLTGLYLSGRKSVDLNRSVGEENQEENRYLIVKGAQQFNLKNIDVKFPLKKIICVTGVSGSGKSTLVDETLSRELMRYFYNSKEQPGKLSKLEGKEYIRRVAVVDQSPIGRTPRSNPATYISAFSHVRQLFSQLEEAKIRGYQPGRFSFNVKGGRCEACEGQGLKKVEMYFLPDIYIECEECKGRRYNKETLEVRYKGENIAETLDMTVDEALNFFRKIPGLERKLRTLKDVGLGYIQLGQPAPNLSGGEAQRIKLAEELSKTESGNVLYILDEPTVGLHADDIKKLLMVLSRLRNRGNTIIVIEHNLDVIKNADWVIDLGPEGGEKGGQLIAQGPPEKIARVKKSYTGQYLKKIL
ncbi:MAG: excinuclease ABC subunit UvrA [Patescibacteria group bacterium]